MREDVIAGFTGTGFASIPPTIAGLQLLGIFGSNGDGKNTDRVAGGPTFVNMTQAPTVGTGWITVNTASSTTKGFDTGLVETAGFVAGGWTLFCIARFPSATGNMAMMSIGTTNALGFAINPSNTFQSSHPTIYVSGFSFALSADNSFDLGASVDQTLWRMYALSWPGGSNQHYTLHDVTGNVSKTTTLDQTRAGGVANKMTIGNFQGSGNTTTTAIGDIAVAGITSGVLSLSDLRTVRTWLLGVCAARNGATGF